MSTTKPDTRNIVQKQNLTRLAPTAGTTRVELDNLLEALDKNVTPPLELRASATPNLQVSIGNITVTDGENNYNRVANPILSTIPAFTGATVTFPASSGGSTTTSTAGTTEITITIPVGEFLKVQLALDTNGDIVLEAGEAGASIAAATLPGQAANTFPIGYVVLENSGGTIQNVVQSRCYQYAGSGSGSGGSSTANINYIENFDFESNITGWATYANTPGTEPVTGSGGSALGFAISTTTTSPLRGTKSLSVSKTSGGNSQGDGFSYDFSIKDQDKSKKLGIQFDFDTTDASYASGYLGVFIYDVDNGNLITPHNVDIESGIGVFNSSFDSTDSSNYRLIIHVRTTNSADWTVKFDNFVVTNGSIVLGPALSKWETPETDVVFSYGATAATNITSQTTKVRRVGENLEIAMEVVFSGAANADGDFRFTLPDGHTVSTQNRNSQFQVIGDSWLFTSSKLYLGTPRVFNSNQFHIIQTEETGSGGDYYFYGSTTPANNVPSLAALASGDRVNFVVSIPVTAYENSGIVPMLSEDNLSQWQPWTPSNTQGLGTITSNNLEYRKVGDSMQIRGDFVTGTVSASEAQLELPGGLTIASPSSSTIQCGMAWRDLSTANHAIILATDGDTYLNFGYWTNSIAFAPLTAQNGSDIFTNSNRISISTMSIKIAEWAGSQNSLVGYTEARIDKAGLVNPTNTSGFVHSGTYTPSFTSGSGTTATPTTQAGDGLWSYSRIGNMVILSGQFAFTKNANTVTFTVDLPIDPSANFPSTNTFGASFSTNDDSEFISGQVFGTTGAKTLTCTAKYTGTTNTAQAHRFTIAYPLDR